MRQGPPCSMGAALNAMSPELRAQVIDTLRTPGINASTVAALLQADGYTIQPGAVLRHRRRIVGTPGDVCGCDP
jgi:hypothetical protein